MYLIVKNQEELLAHAREYHATTSEWLRARREHGHLSSEAILAKNHRDAQAIKLADYVNSAAFALARVPTGILVAQDADVSQTHPGQVGLALGVVLREEEYVEWRRTLESTGAVPMAIVIPREEASKEASNGAVSISISNREEGDAIVDTIVSQFPAPDNDGVDGWTVLTSGDFYVHTKVQLDHNVEGMPYVCHQRYRTHDGTGSRRVAYGASASEALERGMTNAGMYPVGDDADLTNVVAEGGIGNRLPWSCDVCGEPGWKAVGPEGYCHLHWPVLIEDNTTPGLPPTRDGDV